MAKEYYTVLGVDEKASTEDIKKAYRKLTKDHHPDRGGDVKQFHKIQEAYETLSHPQKRQEYDHPGPKINVNFGNDPFANFFRGGNSPFGFDPFASFTRKSRNISINLRIDFLDAIFGKQINLTIKKRVKEGNTIKNVDENVNIMIPSGIESGRSLRIKGQGHRELEVAGDLIINIHVAPHEYFVRRGRDILIEVPISLVQAIKGDKIVVPTIHGDKIKVSVPPGTSTGRMLRIKEQGLSKVGDMLVVIHVEIPKDLDDDILERLSDVIQSNQEPTPIRHV